MTIVKKTTIILLLFSLIPLMYISYQFYSSAQYDIQKKVLNDLIGNAERQKNRITYLLLQKNERLVFVQNKKSILNAISLYNKGSGNQQLNKELLDAKDINEHFKEISVLNLKGKVIASSNQKLIGKDYSESEFFDSAKEKNDVSTVIKDVDGSQAAYLAGPLTEADQITGILLVKTDNDTLLSVIQDYSGLGETGEIIIVNKGKDGNAQAITPLRFKKDAAFNLSWPQDSIFPANEALNGTEITSTNAVDYRGVEVVAATQHLEETNWGIIVKMDKAEALSPLSNLRNKLIIQLLIATIIILVLSRYFAQIFTKPIKNLLETAEKLKDGNLSARANVYSEDELGKLAKTFNEMGNEIEITFNMLKDKARENKELEEKLMNPLAKEELGKIKKYVKALEEKIK